MRMMRANLKTGLCDCLDCRNGNYVGRAAENIAWRAEVFDEMTGDDTGQELRPT